MKKIVLIFIFTLLLFTHISPYVNAKNEKNSETFEISKRLMSDSEEEPQTNPNSLLNDIFGFHNWKLLNKTTVDNITDCSVADVQNKMFKKDIIQSALSASNSYSSYGGCGPIAMMGIIDYFANVFPHLHIASNETYLDGNKLDVNQYDIALNVLNNTSVFNINDQNTFTSPVNYVESFNEIMKNYGLENIIQCENLGCSYGLNQLLPIIKNYIDLGIPVTMYNLGSEMKYVKNHYVNIVGYSTHYYENDEQKFTQDLLLVKLILFNINDDSKSDVSPDLTYYVDPAILNHPLTGLISYSLLYDEEKIDFSYLSGPNSTWDEINESPISEEKNVNMNFSLQTNRLRCNISSTLYGRYLKLSSEVKQIDDIYVDNDSYFEFVIPDDYNLGALDIKFARLNDVDEFDDNDFFIIMGYDSLKNQWINIKQYYPKYFPSLQSIVNNGIDQDETLADNLVNNRIYIKSSNYTKIKFYFNIHNNNITQSKKIIFPSLNLYFYNYDTTNSDDTHIHDYTYEYSYLEIAYDQVHVSKCICGADTVEPHNPVTIEGSLICSNCQYIIEQHDHAYILKKKDDNMHVYECDCGKTIEEKHQFANDLTSHTDYICTICEENVLIGHIYGSYYDNINEQIHKSFCTCNEFTIEEHNYLNLHYGNDDYHIMSCVCESFIEVDHVYTNNPRDYHGDIHVANCVCGAEGETAHIYSFRYEQNNRANHIAFCECGYSKYLPHAISPDSVGLRFANCIFCNYLLDLRSDFSEVPGVNNYSQSITDNGSYIHSSGIYVLVDKDVLDYLNGKLNFKKKENCLI